MTLFILAILLIALLLIATEPINKMNKAAVAIFAGVTCWLLYISDGSFYIIDRHPFSFLSFLSSHAITATSVKEFIARFVFFDYLVQCANIVLFLLATMSIVEVLNNNGCFDFITEWLRTRRPKKLLWVLASLTFLLSANLDNLATVVLLLTIVHPLLQTDKLRKIYCSVIILAANCGGAMTVIGDITSLTLWSQKLVTPTEYFYHLAIPVVAALVTILFLLHHTLPSRIEFAQTHPPYRGDDTLLTRPQRLLLLFVGIGGLWFIPTFHRITLLPSSLGALCVLALIWIVNELCNRSLLGSDTMVQKRLPQALQYANLQNILYFVGISLMFGALTETGLLAKLNRWILETGADSYVIGIVMSGLSAIFGNIATLIGGIDIFHVSERLTVPAEFACDGQFWYVLSFATTFGGSLLIGGTVSGILLMRMEGISAAWYIRHITPKVLAGLAVGMLLMWGTSFLF